MSPLTSVLAIAFIGAAALLALKALTRGKGDNSSSGYVKAPALFTPAERSFLGVLDQAVGDRYRVFGKVRVADVLAVRHGLSGADRQRAFNRISAKHFDFVLCDPRTLEVEAVIELDDASHSSRRGQTRDALIEDACRTSQLRLVRVKAQRAYAVQSLRSLVIAGPSVDQIEAASDSANPVQTDVPTSPRGNIPAGPTLSADGPQALVPFAASPATENVVPPVELIRKKAPDCPRCGGGMVKRKGASGALAGVYFWGCSAFPKCRGLLECDPKTYKT